MSKEYEKELRKRMVEKLDDLRSKIESNESFPEGEQTIDTLIRMDDSIDECLSFWYY